MTGDVYSIERLTPPDLQQVLADHPLYWGERDLRGLHVAALVHEFGSTCLVVRAETGILAYIIGFVTPDGTGYVHLVATRDDVRGQGLGRVLYTAFTDAARRQGAQRLKAVTSPGNSGSIAFHRALGFTATLFPAYDGPHRPMVQFMKQLAREVASARGRRGSDASP